MAMAIRFLLRDDGDFHNMPVSEEKFADSTGFLL